MADNVITQLHESIPTDHTLVFTECEALATFANNKSANTAASSAQSSSFMARTEVLWQYGIAHLSHGNFGENLWCWQQLGQLPVSQAGPSPLSAILPLYRAAFTVSASTTVYLISDVLLRIYGACN